MCVSLCFVDETFFGISNVSYVMFLVLNNIRGVLCFGGLGGIETKTHMYFCYLLQQPDVLIEHTHTCLWICYQISKHTIEFQKL